MKNKNYVKISIVSFILIAIIFGFFILEDLTYIDRYSARIYDELHFYISKIDNNEVSYSDEENISLISLENDNLFIGVVNDLSSEEKEVFFNLANKIFRLKKYNIDTKNVNNIMYFSINDVDYPIFYLSEESFIFNFSSLEKVRKEVQEKKQSSFVKEVLLEMRPLLYGVMNDDGDNVYYQLSEINDIWAVGVLPLIMAAKPVIYLYPEEPIDISVKLLGPNLTVSYPKYNDGWNIIAHPDGTLIDYKNRQYNYLYWEGMSNDFLDMTQGFVVKKENLISFLESKLSKVGLSDKEACDFISYWLPLINKYEYILVSFQMENYEKEVSIEYSIQPDNELRLFVAFKGLEKYVDIPEQDLSYYNKFNRDGFYVVEWGGTLIK